MMNHTQKTYTLYVHGMHCNSCVLITESELQEVPYITSATTSLHDHTVEVTGNFGDRALSEIAADLTKVLIKHGYSLSSEKEKTAKSWSDFIVAIPVALLVMVLFIALQKTGFMNLVDTRTVNYTTAFAIGVIASLSTCMAVVGGLVLSMSATFAKNGKKVQSQILFQGGRIISFFVLGGIIGAAGAIFTLTTTATLVLSVAIGLVMILLGINLLDIVPWAEKLQPSMPKFLARYALGTSRYTFALAPFFVGVATFFLPCGFTQSMQVYTLTTGSFLKGGLTMLSFALGTLPVLGAIGITSFKIQKSQHAGALFKTAGLITIAFAVFNIINGLVVAGLLPPIFTF